MSTGDLNIALVNVVKDGDYQYEQEIPLGIACIGAFLRQKGYQTIIQQCFVSRGQKEIIKVINLEADVYGFQLNMVNYTYVIDVAKQIKSHKSDAVIVLGGPFLVSLAKDILRNESLFDFMVIGEGEYTLIELLKALKKNGTNFSAIKGLIWRNDNGEIIQNALRKPLEDLDKLPFPARDFLDKAQKDPVDENTIESVRVITSRGCIGSCSFCCVNLYSKVHKSKRWRGRSPKHVVDELEFLIKKYRVRLFNFSDSSFEDPGKLGKQRAKEICQEIIKRELPLSAKIYMRCETMKSHEDIELLKLYKNAGIDVVIPGAEAGSDYELKFYEKRATIEDNFRTLKILRDLDLFYVLTGFIMFGPNSTKETLLANLDFMKKAGFAHNLMLLTNVLILIRHSKLYHKLKEEGRVIESPNYWTLPKYKFMDPMAKMMAEHFDNIYARFPATAEINALQINLGNLIARMTNPMNNKILSVLHDDYWELKNETARLNDEIGNLNYDYFNECMSLIENNSPPEKLEKIAGDFFNGRYIKFIPVYSKLYNGFLDKVQNKGFGLSGLVFKHFLSSIALDRPYEEKS